MKWPDERSVLRVMVSVLAVLFLFHLADTVRLRAELARIESQLSYVRASQEMSSEVDTRLLALLRNRTQYDNAVAEAILQLIEDVTHIERVMGLDKEDSRYEGNERTGKVDSGRNQASWRTDPKSESSRQVCE